MSRRWAGYFILIGLVLVIVCVGLIEWGAAEENSTVVVQYNGTQFTQTFLQMGRGNNVTTIQTIIPGNASNFHWVEPVGSNGRPDVVYYGEVARISELIGWADNKGNYYLDYWFANQSCGYTRAGYVASIIKPRGVLIDRLTFPYEGIYYQHQLEGEYGCSPIMEVREGKRLINETLEKARQENQTTPVVFDPWPPLPLKYSGYNYLIPRGQPVNFTGSGYTWYWVFHIVDDIKILQHEVFDVNQSSEDLEPGVYRVHLQGVGNSSTIGTNWYPAEKRVRCAAVPPSKELGLNLGPLLERDLVSSLNNPYCNDDTFQNYTARVQEPYTEISDVFTGSNVSINNTLYVQGYTNLQPGTVLKVSLDKFRWTHNEVRRHTKETIVTGGAPGYFNTYRTEYYYDPAELLTGNNTLTITDPFGHETSVDFKVNEMPEGMRPPQFYQKYFNNTEWYPTPTPVIQEKILIQTVRVIETQTIIVKITANQTQLNEASWNSLSALIWAAGLWLVVAVFAGMLMIVIWKVYVVWKRNKS